MITDLRLSIGRLVLGFGALSLLAACGVKGDPIPPGADKPSSVVSSTAAARGSGLGRDSVSAVRGSRIAGNSSTTITNAEVTRNLGASRKSFLLDPLLN
ncbi:lipoprotein [Aurantimonas sp. Leaf443]|uniref:lipoprotein n=1 Tax=Aurantimonas sp. Leaf443 TaxID=1736378 RepID=UPI0006FF30A9|nr:lipoprotein [Aurantimonas sp. Leaf443]KQT85837.1 hypothetical protein ASG48_04285 [Aurantimonas sp. Leaf443]